MSKSYQHLNRDERAAIAIGLEQGLSRRAIARRLNRSPSTISREVRPVRSRAKGQHKRHAAYCNMLAAYIMASNSVNSTSTRGASDRQVV